MENIIFIKMKNYPMNTMSETVSIAKEEYDFLVRCKKILELETDEDFTPEFLKKLEKARKDIKAGKGLKFKTKEEVEKYFRAM